MGGEPVDRREGADGPCGPEIATDFTRLKSFFADLAGVMEHDGFERRGDGDGASYLHKYKQLFDMHKMTKVFAAARSSVVLRTDVLVSRTQTPSKMYTDHANTFDAIFEEIFVSTADTERGAIAGATASGLKPLMPKCGRGGCTEELESLAALREHRKGVHGENGAIPAAAAATYKKREELRARARAAAGGGGGGGDGGGGDAMTPSSRSTKSAASADIQEAVARAKRGRGK